MSVDVTAIVVALIAAVPGLVAAWVTLRLSGRVRTGNGRSPGETIGDIAATVEITQAQVHSNTREFDNVHRRLGRIEDKIDQVEVSLEHHLAQTQDDR